MPLLDVSAGAEYILTDNFSAFVDINNLLDNNRERWHSYQTYGLNVMIGIQGRFLVIDCLIFVRFNLQAFGNLGGFFDDYMSTNGGIISVDLTGSKQIIQKNS